MIPATRDRAGVVLLAALAPAAMLAFDPGGLYPFGPAKWLAVSTLVPAGAAALWFRHPLRWAPGPALAMAALVAAMALAAAVGEDGVYAWVGTPERHLGVLTWVLVAVAFVAGQSLGAGRAPAIGRGLVVAGVGAGVAAAAEAVGLGPDTLDAGSRLGATFGSPAYLGAACCLLLPVALAAALDGHQPRAWRGAAAVAAATTAVATVGSGARAAWVGLATALVVTAVANRHRLPRVRRPVPVVAGAVAVAPAVLLLTPAGGRIAQTFDADAPGGRGRLDEWRVATKVLAAHPLTGVGPEGYRIAFADGVDAAYEAEHGRTPLPDRAHSAPLDIALAGGPLGLLAWGAVVATTAPFVRRALRGADPLLIGAGAAVVAYVAGELLLFPLAELEPVAALLAGLVVDRQRPPRAFGRGGPALLAALAVVALTAGALDVAADRHAHAAVDALGDGATGRAVDEARRAVDLRPDVLRDHLLLAIALEADDQGIVTAVAAVDDALALSPGDPIARRRKAELLVRRARATLVPDHIEAARTYVEALLRDDPLDTELRRLAGELGDGTG